VPALAGVDRAALARTYFGTLQIDGLLAMCEGWPPGSVDADFRQPLVSSVPALVLSGEVDPVTPASNGERVAKGFRDVKHVVLQGQGHGQLAVGCAPRVIAAFLDAGTTRDLDVRCLDLARPEPFFVDAAGPTP
jgi:pimeloyl-ACP methyl ester carboxylesterase